MPTYEYECKTCGLHFEAFQKITDQPKEFCPKCGGNVRRIIGMGAGIIFSRTSLFLKNQHRDPDVTPCKLLHSGKGPGFYATDYRKHSDSQEQSKLH